jgi:hypothetical protein
MAKTDGPMGLVAQAGRELGLLNRELADLMRVNKRTVQRWLKSGFGPMSWNLKSVAEAIWTRNPELARQLAAHAGTTLEAWGLVLAPVAGEATPAPAPPATTPMTTTPLLAASQEHADSIIHDAANAMDLPPRAVLPGVAAAFRRALALGVDPETVLRLWDQPPNGGPTTMVSSRSAPTEIAVTGTRPSSSMRPT